MSDGRGFRVAIVGGGIGGLALASGLQRSGISFDIYEAAPSYGEIGAGISLGKNAQQALQKLGLFDEYAQEATFYENGLFFEFRDGERKGDNLIKKKHCSSSNGISAIHRARLIEILKRGIPDASSHFNKRLDRIENTNDDDNRPLQLVFADGGRHEADVVVGCDGIRSYVRPYVSKSDNVQWSGTWAYRALIPAQKFASATSNDRGKHYVSTPQMICGRNRHALLFPIDHGKTINLVAFETDRSSFPRRPNLPADAPWTQDTDAAEMSAAFQDFDDDIQSLLKIIEKPNKWALHQLIPGLNTFSHGRICLLGDAAHGGTPHQGAMAGQALEDAVVLAAILSNPQVHLKNLGTALRIYDEVRRPRANRVLLTSLECGDMLEYADRWQAGPEAVREDVSKRWDWIWEHDIGADVTLAAQRLSGDLQR